MGKVKFMDGLTCENIESMDCPDSDIQTLINTYGVYLKGACHPDAPSQVLYKEGKLFISCNCCGGLIYVIKVVRETVVNQKSVSNN